MIKRNLKVGIAFKKERAACSISIYKVCAARTHMSGGTEATFIFLFGDAYSPHR